jgi:hypothetical protein
MRIIVPIIKLKAEQSKSELRNLSFEEKQAKTEKIYRIFISKMEQNHHDLSALDHAAGVPAHDHLGASPPLESVKTLVKSNLLKFTLQKKLLSIVLDEAATEKNVQELGRFAPNINYYLQRCFASLDCTRQYLDNGCTLAAGQRLKAPSVEQQVYTSKQQGKILFRLAKFSDKLLRKMEQRNSAAQILLDSGLKQMGKSEGSIAKVSISSGLQALNMGYLQASDIIPRMLDVLGRFRDTVKDEVNEHSKTTPAWLFLRWISQIAAILNRPESAVIQGVVSRIAAKYP